MYPTDHLQKPGIITCRGALDPGSSWVSAPSRSATGGDDDGEGNLDKAQEAQTGGKAMGRPPADERDVYVYVPGQGGGALHRRRAPGGPPGPPRPGGQPGEPRGWSPRGRALTTLDDNPEVVEKLLETADTAVQETSQIGPGGDQARRCRERARQRRGDSLGNLTGSLGDSLSSVADKANPKRLVSGDRSNGSSASSNRSRAVATAGATGLAGLVGAVQLGGRKNGAFGRRSTFGKFIDKARP